MVFNRTSEQWEYVQGYWTAREIWQQPVTWRKTLKLVKEQKEALQAFIDQVLEQPDFEIILSGAGTSEFIGNALYSYLGMKSGHRVRSYGTTDIVASPENYLNKDKPTLMISYGRSGNSPESVAAVECANMVCDRIWHLFVTCNHDGALSRYAQGRDNCYALNLPEETHDQSFAMTSSFTNMYLATLGVFNLDKYEQFEHRIREVIERVEELTDSDHEMIKAVIDDYDLKRIVYLGSNTNKGIAQESALKMCELTAGKVVTVFDTPMGFRHGPKSVIDDDTLTVIYMSDDPYTRQYEVDLLKEMASQRKGNRLMVLMGQEDEEIRKLADYAYCFNNEHQLENVLLGMEYIVVAQLMAMYKSLSLNITPDNPCPSGEVNRVVKGVVIYPYGGQS